VLLTTTCWCTRAGAASSSYSRYHGGAKALYLLLEDLGYRTSREFSFLDLGDDVDVLVQIGPPLSKTPMKKIIRWVREGHTLVLALPLASEIFSYCEEVRYDTLVLKRSRVIKTKSPKHADLEVRPSGCVLKAPAGSEVLVGSEEEALAVHLPLDKGKILLLAHEDLLINDNLHRDDLVVAIRRWLSDHAPARGKVVFLEQRGGMAGLGDIVGMLRRANLDAFLLHGLIWLLMLYWCLAPRTGDPVPVFSATRREFSQHARALGHLYQRRRASAHVLKHQYERFLDRLLGRTEPGLAQSLGAGARAKRGLRQNRTALASLIATRTAREPDNVESILAQVEYTSSSSGPEDAKDVQRHFRLSQSLAALQSVSVAKITKSKGKSKDTR
jgi:hypothetical protein